MLDVNVTKRKVDTKYACFLYKSIRKRFSCRAAERKVFKVFSPVFHAKYIMYMRKVVDGMKDKLYYHLFDFFKPFKLFRTIRGLKIGK